MKRIHQISPFLVGALLLGCSDKPGRISPPAIDPQRAARLAIEELDRSNDGVLQRAEIGACPALMHAANAYDTDHNGELTVEELKAGIGRWASSRTGAILLPFRAQLNGRPLADAEVILVPVSFMEGEIGKAQGKADRRGAGMLGLAPEDRPPNAPPTPLVPPGLYRVEIRHPTVAIPPQFNSQSTLGIETFVAAQNPAGVIWDLRAKKN